MVLAIAIRCLGIFQLMNAQEWLVSIFVERIMVCIVSICGAIIVACAPQPVFMLPNSCRRIRMAYTVKIIIIITIRGVFVCRFLLLISVVHLTSAHIYRMHGDIKGDAFFLLSLSQPTPSLSMAIIIIIINIHLFSSSVRFNVETIIYCR